MADVNVSHNESESRFECNIDGQLCVAEYESKPGEMVLTHTEVPRELGGRGIAQALAKTALNHARDQKLKVVPLCSFMASYIERHPEYKELT